MKTLIVDDEDTARYGIRKALRVRGTIYEAATLQAAKRILLEEQPQLILLDLNLAGEDGFEVLQQSTRLDSPPKVIVITAHGNEQIAVQAMKRGAFDYLAKPFDIDELRLVVRNAVDQIQLLQENRQLKTELAATSGYGEMIGTSDSMQKVYEMIDRVAETDVTVLLTGESGSGKELVAREIHRRSMRSDNTLVSVNCAAIPDTLIESELFGHEKGAFTDASNKRTGKFERAQDGTLLLDEIGDMALETQAKLLRVLEDKTIERLGGDTTIPVDVRIISATNQDLAELVAEKRFREDLYYRLEVVRIEIPPLRQRREDIPQLVKYFLEAFSLKHKRPLPEVTSEALNWLVRYNYPGNVRQLKNIMERTLILSTGEQIDKKDLPNEVRFFVPSQEADASGKSLEPFFNLDYKSARETFESRYLIWNLREHQNNITHTAEAIGIHRQSLQQKIKDLSLRELMDE
jgi:two-component system response regulator AtoC/two-component system nitrogen regulation response regulator NtrX